MLQIATTLPASVPYCNPNHRPQLVECRGAPLGHKPGQPYAIWWHIECCRCGIATVPSPSRALAELRWTDEQSQLRIPLSQIGQARERAAAALATAA